MGRRSNSTGADRRVLPTQQARFRHPCWFLRTAVLFFPHASQRPQGRGPCVACPAARRFGTGSRPIRGADRPMPAWRRLETDSKIACGRPRLDGRQIRPKQNETLSQVPLLRHGARQKRQVSPLPYRGAVARNRRPDRVRQDTRHGGMSRGVLPVSARGRRCRCATSIGRARRRGSVT